MARWRAGVTAVLEREGPDRALAVPSAGTVGVCGRNDEPPSKQGSLGIDCDLRRPRQQFARNQELHPAVRMPLVRREVLAKSVGVDRHLGGLASADGRNEVQSDQAALFAGQLERGGGDGNLHASDSRSLL